MHALGTYFLGIVSAFVAAFVSSYLMKNGQPQTAKLFFLYLPIAYIVLMKALHVLMPDEWSTKKEGEVESLSEAAPKWIGAMLNGAALSCAIMVGYGYAHWAYFRTI